MRADPLDTYRTRGWPTEPPVTPPTRARPDEPGDRARPGRVRRVLRRLLAISVVR